MQCTRSQCDEHARNRSRGREFLARGQMDGPTWQINPGFFVKQPVPMGFAAIELMHSGGLWTVQRDHLSLHDVCLAPGKALEGRGRDAEILSQNRLVEATHAVAEPERAVLRVKPVIEG